MRAAASLLLSTSLGCQALADPQLEYVDCFPREDGTYEEPFDKKWSLAERCWRSEKLHAPGFVGEDDGDLVLHPLRGSEWSDAEQGAFFYQQVAGDFLAVARAEAVSGLSTGDHCLNSTEAAGLVVRRAEPLAWSTLLVRPDLDDSALQDPAQCGDEIPNPPRAQVVQASYGFGAGGSAFVGQVGSDAEADVALCRVDDELFFFIQDAESRDQATREPNLVPKFDSIDVGFGPLQVSVTATSRDDRKTFPEGHFGWVFLKDYGSTHSADGCQGALERFRYPDVE